MYSIRTCVASPHPAPAIFPSQLRQLAVPRHRHCTAQRRGRMDAAAQGQTSMSGREAERAGAAPTAAPGDDGPTTSSPAAPAPAVREQPRTCRRCHQQFLPSQNHPQACRYHSALWTGGEVGKAIGFCRQSDAPEHQLKVVAGRTGLIRFWDCCGAEEESAPGCCTGRHLTYDDPDD